MPAWRYPFVWAAGGLITGSLLAEMSLSYALMFLIPLVGLAAYMWFILRWGRLVWGLPLFALMGWGRAWVERKAAAITAATSLRGQVVKLAGYLLEEPLRTKKAYRLLVQVDSVYLYRMGKGISLRTRVLLYVRDSTAWELSPGTRIRAICQLDSVRFGQRYWAQQKVYLSGFSERVEPGEIQRDYWYGYFQRVRQHLVMRMQAAAPAHGAPLAVIQALLLGYRRGVDPEVRDAFQLSGTAHILAVSGMHVGLVLSLWLFLLGKLPAAWGRHWISQGALICLVVFYGFLTGATPSAIRAVIMGSLAILARMVQQPYRPLNALGFAAFLQSAADPMVIYQYGFQLSYAAVGGIMAFYVPLRTYLFRSPHKEAAFMTYVKDILAVSVAAQLGTFFLSWAYFGRFPSYFLLSNLMAIPLATGIAFTAVGWIVLLFIPGVETLAGYPVYGLAWLLVESVRWLSTLPGGSVSLPPLPPYMGIIATLLLLIGGGTWLHCRIQTERTPWFV